MYFKQILIVPNPTYEKENEWRVLHAGNKKHSSNETRYRVEGKFKSGGEMFARGYLDELIFMMKNSKEEIKRVKDDPTGLPDDIQYIKERRQLAYMLKLATEYIKNMQTTEAKA